ncbi:MAG: carbohydrate kinase, partial [Paracoccaceae bacterium]
LSDETLRQALAHGARVAAITVTRAGANPPWAEEL